MRTAPSVTTLRLAKERVSPPLAEEAAQVIPACVKVVGDENPELCRLELTTVLDALKDGETRKNIQDKPASE